MTLHPFIVTGGSSGIGECVARRLIDVGEPVIVLDRTPPAAGLPFVPCDLSRPESIANTAEALPQTIAGLANVAGVSGATGARKAFEVNFLGLRELTEILLPRVADGGAVVNVASTAGANWRLRTEMLRDVVALDWHEALDWFLRRDLDSTTAYDISKELVVYYTQLIASRRFRGSGVRVNTVSPGPVLTPLLAEFETTMGSKSLDRLRELAGRNARPDEIATAVMFLLLEEASWINGVDLHVDGGVEAAFNTGVLTQSRTSAHRLS